ncbi:hypothetical protein D3C76_1105640 [compost metagenome]
MFGRRQVQAGQAILGAIHGVALEPEVVSHVGQDVAIVFNQQDAHADLLCDSLG